MFKWLRNLFKSEDSDSSQENGNVYSKNGRVFHKTDSGCTYPSYSRGGWDVPEYLGEDNDDTLIPKTKLESGHVYYVPEGGYTAFKVAYSKYMGTRYYTKSVLKLHIPEGERIVCPRRSNKMRASKVITEEIFDIEIHRNTNTAHSMYDKNTKYEVGEETTPRVPLDTDTTVACNSGIHFFRTEREAVSFATGL